MSMTGFGRGFVERDGKKLLLELKSVNHRFLDISMRLPKALGVLEEPLRRRLQEKLSRGHIDVYLKYQNEAEGSKSVHVDEPLLGAYLDSLKQVERTHGLLNDLTLSTVLRMPEVIVEEGNEEDEEALKAMLFEATDAACEGLTAMRSAEGERLKADFQQKLDGMLSELKIIEERSPNIVTEYREKLRARIAELTEGVPFDEQRLATEVAYMADHGSIDEEIVRFKSHVKHFRDTVRQNGAIGRKLDFIVQEMNREVNTICSKAADLVLINSGIALKGEIEKIREQVQNIE
jgi:uncharacterized protein (TIGR00255 family)